MHGRYVYGPSCETMWIVGIVPYEKVDQCPTHHRTGKEPMSAREHAQGEVENTIQGIEHTLQ